MLKKTSIKSLFRITALTMAFLIFAVTGAQSYSLAAGAETLQRDQETVSSTVEDNSPDPTNNETPNITEEALSDETLNNDEETSVDENFHNVNVGDLEIMGEDTSRITPMAHPIVWAGMGIGQLLGWLLGGAAVTAAIINGYVEAQEFVRELSKSKEKNQPKYYRVKYDKQNMYVGSPLTDQQAYDHLASSPFNEIWTPDYNSGRIIAAKFGTVDGPKIHNDTGYNDTRYWWHFHGESKTYRTGHIFYGTASQLGIKKR